MIHALFTRFEPVLGPVCAAKCLHLLAPRFFPLWDRAIAAGYGLPMKKLGDNADHYIAFMRITQLQCRELAGRFPAGLSALKVLDEFNYCRFTRRWDLAGDAP